jgi:S-DNA-T family DNA segregation ATPase FtsK/SpoIIIE
MARYSKVVKKRKKNGLSRFINEDWQAYIARRLLDGLALSLVFGSLFMMAALFSYKHTDKSSSTASSLHPVQNWGGSAGAWLSDMFVQTMGMGSVAFALMLAVWGIRVFRRDVLSPFWSRFAALFIAATFMSIAFARVTATGWVTQQYLGGIIGANGLNFLAQIFHGPLPGHAHLIAASLAGIIAFGAFLWAAAVSRDEICAFFQNVIYYAMAAGAFVINSIQSFRSWIDQYNDDSYVEEKRKAKAKADKAKNKAKAEKEKAKAKAKAEKERRKAALMADDEEEYEEEDEEEYEESEEDEEYEDEESSDEEYEEDEDEESEYEDEDEDDDDSSFAAKRAPKGMMKSIKVVAPKRDKNQKTPSTRQSSFTLETNGDWEMPSMDLMAELPEGYDDHVLDEAALQKNAEMLQNVLNDFNVNGEIVAIHPGPVVTLYELEPAPGTKTSRIINLSDDIARSMSAVSVRCAVIPGKSVIGIEMPNRNRQTVYMRELLETEETGKTKALLPLILGKDIGGAPIIADLAKMPHLLVAGTTGSGKSVAVNTMILSLLYRLPPEKCRFIMIDPKMLELSVYDDIPHLLAPVVTEPGKAIVALKWTVAEMEERYRAMSKLGVRNIEGYNQRLREAVKKGETLMRKVQTGFDPESGKPIFEEQPMDMSEIPYIVVIVDEFADLMLVAGKEVENAIQRLAQMARAAGIHLIMATQRPSVDVITGIIKANFPTRISFQVTSKIDSRTILNEGGAEQLLGMGDMLYMASGGRLTRVHGPFVSDEDVENVVSFLKSQGEPSYIEDVTEGGFEGGDGFGGSEGSGGGSDELYDKAVAIVAREGKASTSFIQRHLQIGYNRAARIVEEMERQGVISKANHAGKREVLIGDHSHY